MRSPLRTRGECNLRWVGVRRELMGRGQQGTTTANRRFSSSKFEVTIGRRIGLYRFCGDIGRGNFSKVKLAVHQLTRDKVAIKVVDLDRAGLDAKALRMLSSEIATLECVHHPNILRLFEVVETLGRVYLVTEWIRGGELYNHITQGGPLREIHAAPLFKQLLLAVKHMHSLGYVHRDIKAENVLLLSEDRLKLADFGFSTQLINGKSICKQTLNTHSAICNAPSGANQKLDTFCGSPPYAAPELFSDDHYIGAPVDVWALGILLYFMVVGNMPFRAPTIPGLKSAILKGDYLLPGQLSLPCIRLIQRVLIHIPAQRPTIDDMLNSQFVTCPKLSADLMQHEINLHSKPVKRSIFWVRTKSHRLRKSASLRDRYAEVVKKPAISMNTRQQDEMFVQNFLQPIELGHELLLQPPNHLKEATAEPVKRPARRYLLCGTLKKKVTPMETEPEKQLSTAAKINPWNVEVAEDCPLFKNYDAETGSCVMLPTATEDLSQLGALEFEARQLLSELGLSSEMLLNARQSGPRSDIIGAYRIVVNRLQKQSWLARKHVEMALHSEPKVEKRIERSCCIL
ncbi:blast:Serine/threonine-protein kinase NIM1 [Drosophila guanche]|uniref:non-specific serine/threonine protein kinase n=3 Tax=Drosophila guanche TaxID=7266 RepID=A0A3B0JC15_DROGU|nr:blast:Serine/threonine-protein kinase NIM1 [Drosophila guanche]